jgi:hypothetical protein
MLRAGIDAQLAAFTVLLADFYPSLNGHSGNSSSGFQFESLYNFQNFIKV